jgi:hypothetical protein
MILKEGTFLQNYQIKCLLNNLEGLGIELDEEDIQIPSNGEYIMNIFQNEDLRKVTENSKKYNLLHDCNELNKTVYVRLSENQLENIDKLINSNNKEFKGRSRSYVIREAVNNFFINK